MTTTQELRTEGVRVSLAYRGVTLRRLATGDEFQGLVEPLDASSLSFEISREEANQSLVHVLRADLPAGGPVRVGEIILQVVTGSRHRLFRVEDHPTNILQRWWADTVTEEAPATP